jgi:hypothetical protein
MVVALNDSLLDPHPQLLTVVPVKVMNLPNAPGGQIVPAAVPSHG